MLKVVEWIFFGAIRNGVFIYECNFFYIIVRFFSLLALTPAWPEGS
jgi:hypothetical protein